MDLNEEPAPNVRTRRQTCEVQSQTCELDAKRANTQTSIHNKSAVLTGVTY
ncbi:hypothetical protein GCM10009001_08370 [Virgibacillus siamensis]|uniref:Uncharacterized protein n=1 Tax=Virgibacillus siamensis TaxID=480071 RepID=A0ABN1FNL1_9BACI